MKPCVICDNTGWVCEGHGNHPWRGVSNRPDSCDFGPGMPCPSSTCEHSLDRRDDDDNAALRADNERLRADRHKENLWLAAERERLTAENERLRAALTKAENTFYEIANLLNDEDFNGEVPGLSGTIIGHRKKYHTYMVEELAKAGDASRAVLADMATNT